MHTMPDNIKMQIYSISMKCKKIHKQIYLLENVLFIMTNKLWH